MPPDLPSTASDYVRLRVVDNGVGISPEARAHLFEPFFTTKDVGKGTGLGLASVYGIVRQSNGFISVESEPGAGTMFTMHFPAVASGESRGRRRGERRQPVARPRDDPARRGRGRGARRSSAPCCGGRATRCSRPSTPRGACDIFERHAREIDLLLTDVVMPEMNGPALAQRLIGSPARAARPVHLRLRRHGDAARSPTTRTSASSASRFRRRSLSERVRQMLSRPGRFGPRCEGCGLCAGRRQNRTPLTAVGVVTEGNRQDVQSVAEPSAVARSWLYQTAGRS